jgi:hypothetical protein
MSLDLKNLDIKTNDINDIDNKDPHIAPIDSADAPIQPVEKPKAKVGRPKRTPVVLPKPKLGIMDKPSDSSHFIEFLYDNPTAFKKIWAFFKSMNVEKIHMLFTKDSINIYCTDEYGKSHIHVSIDCRQVNHYYCEKDLDVGILCKNLELIMNTINKTCTSLLIISTRDNQQRNIEIVLTNELEIEETHRVELIGEYDRTTNNARFLNDDYTIKFELTGTYFKKMIADIKSFSDQITIKKDGPDDPLIFEYIKTDKKIKSHHSIKDGKKISLVDKLGPDDTFRISFVIDYVKPISNSILHNSIGIYAREEHPLKFVIPMDPAIKIVILTDIIDYRSAI